MKAIDKLWAIVRNRLFCDDFVRQVILQGGYVTNEVRKKSVQIGEATTEAIELLIENPHDLYLCLTIIDGDSLDLANLSKLPLSTEWAVRDIIRENIQLEIPLTLKTTLLEYLIPELSFAREQGFHICLNYIAINTLQESIARIQNRVERGGPNVPSDEIGRA